MLPGFASGFSAARLSGRVGFRPASPDRLPMIGALPDPAALTCFPRPGESGMRVACTADLASVTYVFAPPRPVTATAEGTIDPASIPPDAVLTALDWHPME